MGSPQSVALLVNCYDCNRSFNPKVTRYTYICPERIKVRKSPNESTQKDFLKRPNI